MISMRPHFHPRLVNDPFYDPGIYIDCLFRKRAILFDIGDIRRLSPKSLLKVTDVFVSHAHMDHFMGFDWLLRLFAGRKKNLRLYGPPGFIGQVAHKLWAYTWNLAPDFTDELRVDVVETDTLQARRAVLSSTDAFGLQEEEDQAICEGVLLEEDFFLVRAALLDHKIPCLAFALEEKRHVNVWKNKLEDLGLDVGPWLTRLKHLVVEGAPDATPVSALGKDKSARVFPLGFLEKEILEVVPGQKVAYVTDAGYTPGNIEHITALAHEADLFFIEATFLQSQEERAFERYHLSTRQAGTLARLAQAKRVIPFHFSPSLAGSQALIVQEVEEAFGASPLPHAAKTPG